LGADASFTKWWRQVIHFQKTYVTPANKKIM